MVSSLGLMLVIIPFGLATMSAEHDRYAPAPMISAAIECALEDDAIVPPDNKTCEARCSCWASRSTVPLKNERRPGRTEASSRAPSKTWLAHPVPVERVVQAHAPDVDVLELEEVALISVLRPSKSVEPRKL